MVTAGKHNGRGIKDFDDEWVHDAQPDESPDDGWDCSKQFDQYFQYFLRTRRREYRDVDRCPERKGNGGQDCETGDAGRTRDQCQCSISWIFIGCGSPQG